MERKITEVSQNQTINEERRSKMRTLRTNSELSRKTFLGKGINILIGIAMLFGLTFTPPTYCRIPKRSAILNVS